jgi:cupin fold WbuC family metalloprotein
LCSKKSNLTEQHIRRASQKEKNIYMLPVLLSLAAAHPLTPAGAEVVTAPPPSKGADAPGGGVKATDGVKPVFSSPFSEMVSRAKADQRRRRMTDFTIDPKTAPLQTILNTWIEGSYSPIHLHEHWSETFVPLDGAIAFFTWPNASRTDLNAPGSAQCHIIQPGGDTRALIVEPHHWHAMTAAPKSLGYPGHAVVFETSAHNFDTKVRAKLLAPFAPRPADLSEGDPTYFVEKLLPLCPRATA